MAKKLIRNILKIKHPNPKIPPHPLKRDKMLKEWKETIGEIYKGKELKTLEDIKKFQPELDAAEAELDARYQYEVPVTYDTTELEKLIKVYGPLKIGIFEGEFLAFTENEHKYPENLIKRTTDKIVKFTKRKLQKFSRKKNKE